MCSDLYSTSPAVTNLLVGNLKSSNAEQEPTIGGNITPRTDSNKDRRRKNKTDVPDFVEMTESDEDTALLRELLASKPPSGGPKRIKARPHHPQLLIVAEGEPLALIDSMSRKSAAITYLTDSIYSASPG